MTYQKAKEFIEKYGDTTIDDLYESALESQCKWTLEQCVEHIYDIISCGNAEDLSSPYGCSLDLDRLDDEDYIVEFAKEYSVYHRWYDECPQLAREDAEMEWARIEAELQIARDIVYEAEHIED